MKFLATIATLVRRAIAPQGDLARLDAATQGQPVREVKTSVAGKRRAEKHRQRAAQEFLKQFGNDPELCGEVAQVIATLRTR